MSREMIKEAFQPAVKVASDVTIKAELAAKRPWWG